MAYRSILVRRRRALHRSLGEIIEQLNADRLAEHYEVLGHHFAHGEEWRKAHDYLVKAAEKAASAFAVREATVLYGQALDAAAQLGDAVAASEVMALHRTRSQLFWTLAD